MLSGKEKECLDWAAQDKSVKEIAQAMFISTNTVRKHRNKILSKLECKTLLGAYSKIMKKELKDE